MQYDFTTQQTAGRERSAKWRAMTQKKTDIPRDVVPLSVADMEFAVAPEITEEIRRCVDQASFGYTVPTDAYFEAVAGWMQKRHEWAIENEWIVLSPGVVTALYAAVKAYSEPGEGVIIMPPVYHPFYSAIEDNGRRVVKNTLRKSSLGYEIDFDDLEEKARVKSTGLLLLCSPHNPVGRVWTQRELERVAEICLANDVLIIADEIHHDLVMPGFRHTVIHKLSPEVAAQCITCTAPSKTFNLAGAQTSNIVISDKKLRHLFEEAMRENGHFLLNTIGYAACKAAYERCGAWLDELLGVLDGNKRFTEQYVQENMSSVNLAELQGTYLHWYDFNAFGLTQELLDSKMVENNLFLESGEKFGAEGRGFERLNMACPQSVLELALHRMANLVKQLS